MSTGKGKGKAKRVHFDDDNADAPAGHPQLRGLGNMRFIHSEEAILRQLARQQWQHHTDTHTLAGSPTPPPYTHTEAGSHALPSLAGFPTPHTQAGFSAPPPGHELQSSEKILFWSAGQQGVKVRLTSEEVKACKDGNYCFLCWGVGIKTIGYSNQHKKHLSKLKKQPDPMEQLETDLGRSFLNISPEGSQRSRDLDTGDKDASPSPSRQKPSSRKQGRMEATLEDDLRRSVNVMEMAWRTRGLDGTLEQEERPRLREFEKQVLHICHAPTVIQSEETTPEAELRLPPPSREQLLKGKDETVHTSGNTRWGPPINLELPKRPAAYWGTVSHDKRPEHDSKLLRPGQDGKLPSALPGMRVKGQGHNLPPGQEGKLPSSAPKHEGKLRKAPPPSVAPRGERLHLTAVDWAKIWDGHLCIRCYNDGVEYPGESREHWMHVGRRQ